MEPIRETVTSNKRLMEFFEVIMGEDEISWDTETTGTDWRYDVIVGFSISWGREFNSIYVPFGHRNTPAQCDEPVAEFFAESILRNPTIRKFMHNAKFEYHMGMSTWGFLPVDRVDDTLLMAFMIDNDAPLGLKAQAAMHFDNTALNEEIALKAYIKNYRLRCYGEVPALRMGPYAIPDAIYTLKLGQKFWPIILENFSGIYEVERSLTWTTYHMERHGMPVDVEYLKRQYPAVDKRIPEVQALLDQAAWPGFNPRATAQVRKLLYDKLGLPILKRSDKGAASTAEAVILNLQHPIVPIVLEARTLFKARRVYIDNLIAAANYDGRIHTKFNQTGAGTGRFSSSGIGRASINLQNIPREGSLPFSVRSAFPPLEDHILVFLDYVQVEMMLFAHYSQDPGLIEAARSGYDFHLATAVKVFHTAAQLITKPQRKYAKRINFGILYGEGVNKLALELKITTREARRFMNQYFIEFPGVPRFMEKCRADFEHNGYVLNMFGRRRTIPFNKAYRSVNTLIQGSAADVMKHSMRKVSKYLETTNIKLTSTIHDELQFQVPYDEIWRISYIKALMEDFRLLVPIRVDVEWSDESWGKKKAFKDLQFENLRLSSVSIPVST